MYVRALRIAHARNSFRKRAHFASRTHISLRACAFRVAHAFAHALRIAFRFHRALASRRVASARPSLRFRARVFASHRIASRSHIRTHAHRTQNTFASRRALGLAHALRIASRHIPRAHFLFAPLRSESHSLQHMLSHVGICHHRKAYACVRTAYAGCAARTFTSISHALW